MLQMTKILAPIDFSERCVEAARCAGMLACRFHAELTMLHVISKIGYPIAWAETPSLYQDWWTELVAEAPKKLDSFLADEFKGMSVKRVVLEGDPAIQIVDFAHSTGTDLVVMPTHGFGPFRRFILGSVTAKVLHDANCAVLTGVHMNNKALPQAMYRNILCAVDLGSQSRTTLTWAAGIADKTGARLHVVHVLPAPEAGETRYFDQDWRLALERTAEQEIAELQKNIEIPADVIFTNGDVAKGVRSVAESLPADLVVIGRHFGAGILGRLRAHSYAIVRESPCPVVSV